MICHVVLAYDTAAYETYALAVRASREEAEKAAKAYEEEGLIIWIDSTANVDLGE